ncbi:MAG: preprotein translocase subunit YajC [Chitinophagales bacterium]|nr:preprotein translocase subunit YajC [Chitinophagales bacterium]MDW8427081.1 preprotein translocase subunit YajC [Chitinophagales bacterium]
MNALSLLMAPPASGQSGAGWVNLIFLLGIFAIMYFFMIRPQAKKAREQRKFLESLQKGDKVVTVSGIHGRITKIHEGSSTIEVEIDTNTRVVMERSGISMEYTKALNQKS